MLVGRIFFEIVQKIRGLRQVQQPTFDCPVEDRYFGRNQDVEKSLTDP